MIVYSALFQEILMRASLGDGVDDTFAGEQTLCPEK